MRRLVTLIFVMAGFSVPAFAQNVPQFRGLGGRGVLAEAKIPADWKAEDAVIWKAEVEGSGWSQPVIWKDRIYLTTAIADNGFKPKDFSGGMSGTSLPQSMGMGAKRPKYEVEWKVVCLDAATGKQLWSTSVGKARPKFGIHPSNSYATETPAVDDKGIYAYFGCAGVVVGLTHDGKEKWKRNVGVFKTSNDFGTGSSLAIDSGRIFLQLLTEETAKVYCLNNSDGVTVWEAERDPSQKTSWSTPIIWENGMRKELIVSGGKQVNSYDPATGTNYWTLNRVKSATACSVFADDQHIYFGGSDPFSKGPLFAVVPGGSGEITPKRPNQTFETCAWRVPRSGPGMATPVSNGKYVLTTDNSIVLLYQAVDGKLLYKKRLPGMAMVVGSPSVIGDEVLLVDEKGKLGAVKLTDNFEFRKLGSLNDTVWSTAIATKDAIFVRSVSGLHRFRLSSDVN